MSLYTHKTLGDTRGMLTAIEGAEDVPFEIKRVFYIYGVPKNLSRGSHSHHQTKQYLIAVSGSCKVTLDNGHTQQTYLLETPNKGLLQDALVWGTMHDFSENCVLLVLASDHYDKDDYIIDYDVFLSMVK